MPMQSDSSNGKRVGLQVSELCAGAVL